MSNVVAELFQKEVVRAPLGKDKDFLRRVHSHIRDCDPVKIKRIQSEIEARLKKNS